MTTRTTLLLFAWPILGWFVGPLAAQSPEADPAELPRIPPTEPGDALQTFEVRPGYGLELAACEPQVVDPIALAWDARERLIVVEMRGYSERRDAALGRIRLLEDRDADGIYETSQVYAEGLRWPTGVLCYKGGVFVIATPDLLYLKDTDGDGRADEREVVFTGFADAQERLNVQALANSLTWGLDGRVHGATAMNGARLRRPGETGGLVLRGRDFSFDPRTRSLRPEMGGGQYGLTFDDWGNKFVCSNSHHIQWIAYREHGTRLPPALVDIAADGAAAEVFRLSPDEPWRLVRTRWRVAGAVPGPVEGGGRVSGYFTAATGICSHRGDVFTADAGSNLVHRKILHWSGRVQPIARRSDDEMGREFLASRDNWFRPVSLASGPDGGLYIADMYREVIEHPWSLPEGIKKHLDLNAGHDRGRIYRIVPADAPRPRSAQLDMTLLTSDALVEHLGDAIAWRRLTAARLLQERDDPETEAALRFVLEKDARAPARLLALEGLAQRETLKGEDLTRAFHDPEPWIRARAITLARMAKQTTHLQGHLPELLQDPSAKVQFPALLSLTEVPDAVLPAFVDGVGGDDPWCRAALGGAIGKRAPSLVQALLQAGKRVPTELVTLAGQAGADGQVYATLPQTLKLPYLQAATEGGHSIAALLDEAERSAMEQSHGRLARDEGEPTQRRLESIALLGGLGTAKAIATLTAMLPGEKNASVAQKILAILGPRDDFDPESALLERWLDLSPALRGQAIDTLLARDTSTLSLLTRIESGHIRRSSLSGGQVITLQNHRNVEIRRRARALLAPKTRAEREAAVVQARPALRLPGQAERGRIHYVQRCAACHEPSGDAGKTLGPDRRALAQSGLERLLINLIDPNREVLPSYFASAVTRKDGSAVSGIIVTESGDAVVVRQPLGVETEILREDIASIVTEQHSAMPESLEAGLSHQDLADLLRYLTDSSAP